MLYPLIRFINLNQRSLFGEIIIGKLMNEMRDLLLVKHKVGNYDTCSTPTHLPMLIPQLILPILTLFFRGSEKGVLNRSRI